MIQRIVHFHVLLSFTDGNLEDEQLDGFSNVLTNSGGAVIGGTCGSGGGLLVLCLVIYFLYRLLKPETKAAPQSCPRCGNAPRSPPTYSEAVAMEECICCMSAQPANSELTKVSN